MEKVVVVSVTPNAGYSSEQALEYRRGLTLEEIKNLIEEAIENYGEDAVLVTNSGDRYGATWGVIDFESISGVDEYEEDEY